MERLLTRTETDTHIIYTAGHTRFRFDKRDASMLQRVFDRLAAYEDTELEPEEIVANMEMFAAYRHVCGGRPPEEIMELVKARDDGRVVVLEDITVHQANTIMGMCERLNAMKARHGDDQEPLITWQLYNALLKSFARAEAEAALGDGGDGV